MENIKKFDKVICIDNTDYECELEQGALYTVKGFSPRNASYNPDGIKIYEVKAPCGLDGWKLDRFVKVDKQMIDVLNTMANNKSNCA